MFAKSARKKFNFWGDDNHEKLTESPKSQSLMKNLTDLVNPVSYLDQIFASKNSETPNQNSPEKLPTSRHHEFVVFSRSADSESRRVSEETEAVLNILKKQITKLEKSEKALTRDIAKIKVEQIPSKKGIYYLRFFEWLIGVVNGLRLKIDEGRAWLATFNQKKSKKLGYWKMYKKHGTTFGMSQERTLATQTG